MTEFELPSSSGGFEQQEEKNRGILFLEEVVTK
jgi:hypothetical protein